MHFRELIENGNFSAKQEIDCIKLLINEQDDFYNSIGKLIDNNFIKFSKIGPFVSFK